MFYPLENELQGARWLSGRALDCESRDPGFDPLLQHHIVSLSKAHYLPTVLVNTQEPMAPSRHE